MSKTFQQFLEDYKSPYPVWGSKSLEVDIAAPSTDKIQQGWAIEKPKHNYFNWHMHRTDTRVESLEAKITYMFELLQEAGVIPETALNT